MSDGTAALRFLDPETLRETGRIVVKDGDTPVDKLNELELVKGEVYANVWTTDRIAIISPDSGRVTAWLDLAGIRGPIRSSTEDVLNGIAYDAARDRLFVTGKTGRSCSRFGCGAHEQANGTLGRPVTIRAHAKINLDLRVLGTQARRLSRAANGLPGAGAARHDRVHSARGAVCHRVRRGRRSARSLEPGLARRRRAVAVAAAGRPRPRRARPAFRSAFRCRAVSAAAAPTRRRRCWG